MGNLCCCFHPVDPEENNDTSNSQTRACVCPKCFISNLFTKYTAVFDKDDAPNVPAANHTQPDITADANPSSLQQDGLTLPGANVSEASGHIEEQLRGENGVVPDIVSCQVTSNEYNSSTSPIRHPKEKVEPDFCYIYASIDDEDVCPTCLEEYTYDNPRIVAQCNHHYHLCCIYEWQERSETCPLCGKVMVYDEAT